MGGGPCTEQQLGLEDSAAEGWLEAPGRQLHPRWSLRMSAQTSQGHGPGLRSWGGPFLAVQTPPQQPSGPAPSQWSPHSSCFLDLFPEAHRHLGPKPANVQLIPSHPAGPVPGSLSSHQTNPRLLPIQVSPPPILSLAALFTRGCLLGRLPSPCRLPCPLPWWMALYYHEGPHSSPHLQFLSTNSPSSLLNNLLWLPIAYQSKWTVEALHAMPQPPPPTSALPSTFLLAPHQSSTSSAR